MGVSASVALALVAAASSSIAVKTGWVWSALLAYAAGGMAGVFLLYGVVARAVEDGVRRARRAETHRALKARAVAHGRSTEAEVRSILDEAVAPPGRLKLGSLLAAIGEDVGGVDLQVERERLDHDPLDFA